MKKIDTERGRAPENKAPQTSGTDRVSVEHGNARRVSDKEFVANGGNRKRNIHEMNAHRSVKRKNTRRRRRRSPLVPLVMFFLTAVISILSFASAFPSNDMLKNDTVPDGVSAQNPIFTGGADIDNGGAAKYDAAEPITAEISSNNAILINVTQNRTICTKNSDVTAYPASLTKIMTCIVAIENIPEPGRTYITVEEETINELVAMNASMTGFSAGEVVTATDLFYGCLLASGGEASVTLAKYVAGTESDFVALMNQKAEEIGCKSTNFVNVTGLHDINHVSSAEDIARIFMYSLKNETFRNIITTSRYYSSATDVHEKGITITSTVSKAFSAADRDIGFIAGGKTGYTNEAKLCLATLYVKGDYEYVLVTLGAGDGTNKVYDHVYDTLTIYEMYT